MVDIELLALELGIWCGVAAHMVEIDAAIPLAWHAVLWLFLVRNLPVLQTLCGRYNQSCYIPFVASGIY